jgi:protein disulfide-isomerase A6
MPSTFAFLFAVGAVVELDTNNWNTIVTTSSKNAFVKFYAPWCGHCKKMKPEWDRLGEAFDESSDKIIGDVDCTSETGKPLCERYDVSGFPTLKHIFGTMAEDYKGGRDYDSIKTFADSMKPMCSINSYENCSEDQLRSMKMIKAMDGARRRERKGEIEASFKAADDELKAVVQRLQAQYDAESKRVEKLKEESDFELGVLKALIIESKGKDEL